MRSVAEDINGVLDDWVSQGLGCVCAVVDFGNEATLQRMRGMRAGTTPSFVHPKLSAAQLTAELLPALIPLSPAAWQLRQDTVSVALSDMQSADAPTVCGWVWSAVEPSELASKFAASLLRVSLLGSRCLFRHHDPRVRACLSALLSPQWLAGVLPSQIAWIFLAQDGSLQRCGAYAAIGAAEFSPARVQQAIERCAEINQAIALARTQNWPFDRAAYTVADAALTRAESHGFTGAADRLAFAMHALTVASDFDAHPVISAAIESARRNRLPYVDAMIQVPAYVWKIAARTTDGVQP